MKTFSALSGGIALSIVMLPLMISMIKNRWRWCPLRMWKPRSRWELPAGA